MVSIMHMNKLLFLQTDVLMKTKKNLNIESLFIETTKGDKRGVLKL